MAPLLQAKSLAATVLRNLYFLISSFVLRTSHIVLRTWHRTSTSLGRRYFCQEHGLGFARPTRAPTERSQGAHPMRSARSPSEVEGYFPFDAGLTPNPSPQERGAGQVWLIMVPPLAILSCRPAGALWPTTSF
jgi:hypothetical protein